MTTDRKTVFLFNGFVGAHGYRVFCRLGDLGSEVRLNVAAIRENDKTAIRGSLIITREFSEDWEGPFDIEVFAFNVLERSDYVLKILGAYIRQAQTFNGAEFKAHGLIPWNPKRIRRSKMKINPLNDQVLVKRLQAKETTESGIVIPVVAQEKQVRCEVVATGPGRMLDNGQRLEPSVKTGDIVLLDKWGGREIEIDDEEMLFVKEEDILAVVDSD